MNKDLPKIIIFYILFSLIYLINPNCKSDVNDFTTFETISEEHLEEKQYNAWLEVHEKWKYEKAPVCIKDFNLGMDCVKCSDIEGLVVKLYINREGHLIKYDILSDNWWCNHVPEKTKNELLHCLVKHFYSIKFPKSLHGLILKISLQYGPQC